MKKQEAISPELAKLKAENTRLKTALAKAKSSTTQSKHQHTAWRKALIVLLIGLAGALLVTGNIVFWSARTLVETDRYVAVTSSLIQKPEIQTAIAQKATDEIFNSVDVAQLAQDSLPPKAAFLAPTLETQMQSYTQKAILGIVSSSKFQSVWESTNRTAHERLMNAIKNYQGDGTINLNDIFQKVTQQLSDTKLSFLQGKTLPPKVGDITVVSAPWLPKAHNLVKNLTLIRVITALVFMASIAGAVALSRYRRQLIIRISLILAAVMTASVIAFRVTREIAVNQVNPTYQEAARVAWTTIIHGLFTQSMAIITLLLLVAFAAWVTGKTRRAQSLRATVNKILSGKLHQSVFGKHENGFTNFLGINKRIFQWSILGLGILSMLFTSLNAATLIITTIVVLVILLILEFLAAPVS